MRIAIVYPVIKWNKYIFKVQALYHLIEGMSWKKVLILSDEWDWRRRWYILLKGWKSLQLAAHHLQRVLVVDKISYYSTDSSVRSRNSGISYFFLILLYFKILSYCLPFLPACTFSICWNLIRLNAFFFFFNFIFFYISSLRILFPVVRFQVGLVCASASTLSNYAQHSAYLYFCSSFLYNHYFHFLPSLPFSLLLKSLVAMKLDGNRYGITERL